MGDFEVMDTPRMYALEGGGAETYRNVGEDEEGNINMTNLVDLGLSESDFLSPETTARRPEDGDDDADADYAHIDKNGEFLTLGAEMSMEHMNAPLSKDLTEQQRKLDPSVAEAHDFFSEMDAEFINRTAIEDETFVYAASDVIVQRSLEIPIIVQVSQSSDM